MGTHASRPETGNDAVSPAKIARRILAAPDQRTFTRALRNVRAMAELTEVRDKTAYELVASVRRDLGKWRTPLAREIKSELDTILTLYRVQQWEGAGDK